MNNKPDAQQGKPSEAKVSSPFGYYAAALITVLSIVFLAVGLVRLGIDTENKRLITEHEVAALEEYLRADLEGLMADLLVVAETPALRYGGSEATRLLAQLLLVQVAERSEISQLRILDASGRERMRAERRDGRPVLVPAGELQDKSARYYYQEALSLARGEVFMSPLDLNVENGVIENPWNPTLRLVAKMGANEQGLQFIVANFDARRMLARFQFDPVLGLNRYLVNAGGHWLAGVDKERLWGFMFSRPAEFKQDLPSVWSMMKDHSSGTRVMPGSVVAFTALRVRDAITQAGGTPRTVVGAERLWLVCQQDLDNPFAPTLGRLLCLVAIVVFSVVVAWYWSRSVVARKTAEQQSERAQEELVRSERMASLGGLVAGVAHELNTPIGNAVTTASSMAERSKRIAEEVKSGKLKKSSIVAFIDGAQAGSDMVLRNLERAAELIGRFKSVAVDQASEQRRRFALGPYMQEVSATLAPMFKHSQVELSVSEGAAADLDSYPGALSQVVMNLVSNALTHGFRTKKSGLVTIRTTLGDDNQALVIVEDNGDGISPEYTQRIFDPFFTTRLGEGGSGLGLSIVKNIVENVLGGQLSLDSEQGSYTRFCILIPQQAPTENTSGKDPHDVSRAAA